MNTETIDYVLHLIISDLSVLKRKLKDYREFIKDPICDKSFWGKNINDVEINICIAELALSEINSLNKYYETRRNSPMGN